MKCLYRNNSQVSSGKGINRLYICIIVNEKEKRKKGKKEKRKKGKKEKEKRKKEKNPTNSYHNSHWPMKKKL